MYLQFRLQGQSDYLYLYLSIYLSINICLSVYLHSRLQGQTEYLYILRVDDTILTQCQNNAQIGTQADKLELFGTAGSFVSIYIFIELPNLSVYLFIYQVTGQELFDMVFLTIGLHEFIESIYNLFIHLLGNWSRAV